jgi:hypothetical protein
MSTYWHLYCQTCKTGDAERVGSWNHGVDRGLREVIQLLPAIAQLARATNASQCDLRVEWSGPEERHGLEAFAVEHAGHDVVCKSEYGQIDGRCGVFFHCPNDDCQQALACTLEKGHEGLHRRPKP